MMPLHVNSRFITSKGVKYAFLLLIVILTACLNTSEPLDSGIEGMVTIGPMCPVVQEGVPCPDQPYQAMLTVQSTSGKKIKQFQTDEQGYFKVELAAGEYILHPESPNSLPFAADIPFTVREHQFTQLEVIYDSGIR